MKNAEETIAELIQKIDPDRVNKWAAQSAKLMAISADLNQHRRALLGALSGWMIGNGIGTLDERDRNAEVRRFTQKTQEALSGVKEAGKVLPDLLRHFQETEIEDALNESFSGFLDVYDPERLLESRQEMNLLRRMGLADEEISFLARWPVQFRDRLKSALKGTSLMTIVRQVPEVLLSEANLYRRGLIDAGLVAMPYEGDPRGFWSTFRNVVLIVGGAAVFVANPIASTAGGAATLGLGTPLAVAIALKSMTMGGTLVYMVVKAGLDREKGGRKPGEVDVTGDVPANKKLGDVVSN